MNNDPEIKATTWFSLAIASMVIATVCAAFFAGWIFTAPSEPLMVQRAQAFTPFGAALLAIVTFCTVAWRGVLNTQALEYQGQQLRYQSEQIEIQRMQYEAKSEETLVNLLVEGTRLVADKDAGVSHVLGGIAALQVVITAQSDKFAVQAMDVLINTVQECHGTKSKSEIFEGAKMSLSRGVALGRYSRLDLLINKPEEHIILGKKVHDWSRVKVVTGANHVYYSNCIFDPEDLNEIADLKRTSFDGVEFSGFEVYGGGAYANNPWTMRGVANNILSHCRIREIMNLDVGRFEFKYCDFSGCVFIHEEDDKVRYLTRDLKKSLIAGNFYHEDDPPVSIYEGFPFEEYFEVKSYHSQDSVRRGVLGFPSDKAAEQRNWAKSKNKTWLVRPTI